MCLFKRQGRRRRRRSSSDLQYQINEMGSAPLNTQEISRLSQIQTFRSHFLASSYFYPGKPGLITPVSPSAPARKKEAFVAVESHGNASGIARGGERAPPRLPQLISAVLAGAPRAWVPFPSRKFAPVCSICENPIIPRDGKDAFKIECMGRNFHENCYRCEVSGAVRS